MDEPERPSQHVLQVQKHGKVKNEVHNEDEISSDLHSMFSFIAPLVSQELCFVQVLVRMRWRCRTARPDTRAVRSLRRAHSRLYGESLLGQKIAVQNGRRPS